MQIAPVCKGIFAILSSNLLGMWTERKDQQILSSVLISASIWELGNSGLCRSHLTEKEKMCIEETLCIERGMMTKNKEGYPRAC